MRRYKMEKQKRKIVIAVSGFVFVGIYAREDGMVKLTDASCIRVWGTTAGLGQLAVQGKQKDTVFDYCGCVGIPVGSVVAEIDCGIDLGES